MMSTIYIVKYNEFCEDLDTGYEDNDEGILKAFTSLDSAKTYVKSCYECRIAELRELNAIIEDLDDDSVFSCIYWKQSIESRIKEMTSYSITRTELAE